MLHSKEVTVSTHFNHCPNCKNKFAGAISSQFYIYECRSCKTLFCYKCGDGRCPNCGSKDKKKLVMFTIDMQL